jgi:DNA repair protein RecN (Recombination protein N)
LGALSLLYLGKVPITDVYLHRTNPKNLLLKLPFSLDRETYLPLFEQNEADFETTTLLRREILPEGKSRALVNDSPVNLTVP